VDAYGKSPSGQPDRRFNYLKNLPAIEDAEQAGLEKIAVYFLRNTR
jgi:hypothetical protein